jgi:hypothetical protein
MTANTWSAVTLGLSASWRKLGLAAIAASSSSQAAVLPRSTPALAVHGLEQGFGVRAGNGGEFSHVVPLQLGLQAVEQVGMDAGIDFLAENLLGTLDGQRGHLLTQGFTGLAPSAARLQPGSSNNLVAFLRGAGFGFFDDGLGTAVGVRKTRGRFVAGLVPIPSSRAGWQRQFGLGTSAAARPSAIFWARSSNAFAIGGHTNFIVNHTRIRKTMA